MYQKVRIVAALLGCSILMSSVTSVQAFNAPSWKTTTLGTAALLYFILHAKKSKSDFQPRYKMQELRSIHKIATTKYWKNVWYLINDGFIGQTSKSNSVKINTEKKSFEFGDDKAEAFGVLGKANEYIKPFKSAVETAGMLYLGYKLISNPDLNIPKIIDDKAKI